MLDLPRETAVVLHDAGAANLAMGWIDAGLLPGDRVYAEGPAAVIWAEQKRPARKASIEDALHHAEALVSGTGWQSDIEHCARVRAGMLGMRSYAILDHWVNYPDRFRRNGAMLLPDSMLVADADAERLAVAAFPGCDVILLPNHYLAREVAAIADAGPPAQPPIVLALMEPVREAWADDRRGEFEALDYLKARWNDVGLPRNARLRIRPHPSEPAAKYATWASRCIDPVVEISRGVGLAHDIARASVVVGMNSFALTIALAAGRPTWSILPPQAPPCVLPHAGIRHLRRVEAVGR